VSIRLNLTASLSWLTLAPGLRLLVAPLTTALMVSARADLAIEALADTATQEELALAMAKAVARRAVLDWEGVGDDAGEVVPVSPGGIDALLEIWPVFEAFQTQYVAKGLILDAEKTSPCPCRVVLRLWSPALRDLLGARPRLPARLNRLHKQDGWQVWYLVGHPGGQLRVIPGAVLGWNMSAALATARALGIDTLIAAELLPEIEAVKVPKLNEQISANHDGAFRR